MEHRIRVLVVEDHEIMRFGIVQLLNGAPGVVVSESVSEGSAALAFLRANDVDVVILDISLPDCHGINLIRGIKKRFPSVAVIVLTAHDEMRYGERSIAAGASAFVSKIAPPEQIVEAVSKVARGGLYVSDLLQQRLMAPGRHTTVSAIDCLSDREIEILSLLGQGLSSAEIAEQLQRSIKTIEAHRENIKKKLSLKNANELMRYAICWVAEETGAYAAEEAT